MPSAPPRLRPLLHPLHGLFLAWPVAIFPAALASDITYLNSAEIQWTNFSSWLIAGADVFAGLVLAWALVSQFLGRTRQRGWAYVIVVALMFVAGVLNAFQHARDGWHSVGTFGLVLSILCTILAFVAAFLAYGQTQVKEYRA